MIVHLSILFFLLFINLQPTSKNKRKKYVLPISFVIITIYWALRYDYGLDYWNYYNLFYNDVTKYVTGFGEKWFFSSISGGPHEEMAGILSGAPMERRGSMPAQGKRKMPVCDAGS